jgi:hypothetical protein
MDRDIGAAVRPLPGGGRKVLAIQALAGCETVSDLAAQHGVSRKFVYQQAHKAGAVLDDVFSPAVQDDEVLFELVVTKTWLRQVIVALPLICRSSYRGVMEFLRDLLGLPVSLGYVHDVLQAATRQASTVNDEPDLSGIRVGLHDEIFQGATPVLAGVDAQSTYCYLLAAEQHRDADTWGVHLLDAAEQGLRPDYTIADAGRGPARRAAGGLGRHAVPRRRVPHPAPVREPGQHAVAPYHGRHVAAQDAAGRGRPRWPTGSRRRACQPA